MYNRRCKKCCMHCYNVSTASADMCDNYNTAVSPAFGDSCECGYDKPESVFPENPVLGQSYVPIQKMDKTFIPSVGLKKGTIFPELVKPYRPCQSLEEIAFIKAMNDPGKGCNKC